MRKLGAITTLLMVALFMVPLGAAAFGNTDEIPACPLPSGPGAVVVDISHELMTAWNADESTAGPVSVSVPAGSWDVYLTSYDDHSNKSHQAQTKEQWMLQGWLGDSLVFETDATPDLAEATDVEFFGVGSVTTTQPIDKVLALHAAYPDSLEPHSVAPLCAAFYPSETAPMAPECPFPADVISVTITTGFLLAWDTDASMAGPVPFQLSAGNWDVYLASYDNHSDKSDQAQTREQWYLEGWAGGSVVFTSGITDDLLEDRDGDVFFVGSVTAGHDVDAVKAIHAAYPADTPESVVPLCAAFIPEGTNISTTSSTTSTTSTSSTTSSTTTTTSGGGTSSASTSVTTTTSETGPTNTNESETSVAAGLAGNTAQSLQQLPLTGIQLETAFAAIVALMFGVVLLRRSRVWQSRLDRRAARMWRRPIS